MDKTKLEININKLEQEWIMQPLLYEEVAEQVANTLRQRDTAKTELENIIADVGISLRKEAEAKKEKMTEAKIAELVQTNKEVKQAKNLLNLFNYELQKGKADLEAVETKKRALENLVQLYKAEYFSVPSEGSEHKFSEVAKNEVKKQIKEEHKEELKKRKKRDLGKFSEPITSEEEKAAIPDEEKLEKMSKSAKEKYEEIENTKIEDTKIENTKIEKPRRRRRAKR